MDACKSKNCFTELMLITSERCSDFKSRKESKKRNYEKLICHDSDEDISSDPIQYDSTFNLGNIYEEVGITKFTSSRDEINTYK